MSESDETDAEPRALLAIEAAPASSPSAAHESDHESSAGDTRGLSAGDRRRNRRLQRARLQSTKATDPDSAERGVAESGVLSYESELGITRNSSDSSTASLESLKVRRRSRSRFQYVLDSATTDRSPAAYKAFPPRLSRRVPSPSRATDRYLAPPTVISPPRVTERERPQSYYSGQKLPTRPVANPSRTYPDHPTSYIYGDAEHEASLSNRFVREPLPLARFLKQTVLRKSTSVIRPRHINTEASVIVFRESKDAMDATLEKSTDTSGAGDRKPKKPYRRPWLVQVNGSFLVKALKDITGNAFESETLLFIPSPFKLLVPYAKQIENFRDTLGEKEPVWKKTMLDSLLEVIKQDLKPTFEVHSGLLDKTLRTIAFLDLWHIFQPGQIVMSENHGREQLYMVYSTGSNIPIISFQDRQRDSNVTGPSRARRWDVVSPMVDSDEEEAWNFAKDTQSQEDVEYPPFILHVYYMVYDGTLVGPACRTLRIPYYSGEKSVLDLPAYPVSLHPSAQSITDRFLDRGQRFITNYGHKHYEGMTVSADQHEKSFLIDELQGEVYLDIKTGYRFLGKKYMPKMSKPTLDATKDAEARDWESHRRIDRNDFVEHEQNKSVDRKRTNEFLNGNAANYRILSSEKASKIKEYLLLLPHQVPAFVFRLRSWKFLDIDSVRDIDKSDAAAKSGFNDLVIPDAYRRLLISVIESHKSGKGSSGNSKAPKMSTQMDIVRGKGRGLIILLHGPPGVGKTSTAETIAAYSRRPLYPLTSGDIGFTPTEIENNLNYHFSLASQWGCIMLIDEADVFLMKRDWGDIQRNALVSVFLRVLEYYSGILILTTNRTGVIDEAFKSRMHLYLRYPSIDLNSTRIIWHKLLDRIAEENKENDIKIEFDRVELLKFAASHYNEHAQVKTTWNARQIRNAFQTAIAMCQYDRTKLLEDNALSEEAAKERGSKYMRCELSSEYFEKIAASTKDFDSFMISVRGGTDGYKAREEGLRDDDFAIDQPPVAKKYNGLAALSIMRPGD